MTGRLCYVVVLAPNWQAQEQTALSCSSNGDQVAASPRLPPCDCTQRVVAYSKYLSSIRVTKLCLRLVTRILPRLLFYSSRWCFVPSSVRTVKPDDSSVQSTAHTLAHAIALSRRG